MYMSDVLKLTVFQAALSCYSYACSRCPENSPLAVGFNLEVANILKNFDVNENAEHYLKLAASQTQNSLNTKFYCLDQLASCYVKAGKFLPLYKAFYISD